MYDYHSHTFHSDDSTTPIRSMVEAACSLGLKEYAITDHYDPDYPDPEFPFDLNFPEYHRDLNQVAEEFKNKIKIVKGIEIGIQGGDTLEKCSLAAKAYPYDFIIGSFHCAEGMELYNSPYFEGRSIKESYLAFYTYMYNCLREYKDYDVIGHFNIIDRYSPEIAPASNYMDIVEAILKQVIDDGKGIEINTSSFRYKMGDRTTPALEILQLYKDLGGSIITTGSDAHKPSNVGYRLDYAQHMIKSVGLRYLTTFHQRIANFIKL